MEWWLVVGWSPSLPPGTVGEAQPLFPPLSHLRWKCLAVCDTNVQGLEDEVIYRSAAQLGLSLFCDHHNLETNLYYSNTSKN